MMCCMITAFIVLAAKDHMHGIKVGLYEADSETYICALMGRFIGGGVRGGFTQLHE